MLVAASCGYLIVACWWTRSFFRNQDWQTQRSHGFAPPVSILKPVCGLDAGAYDNFASFLRQDYPEYEVLFAVSDPDDPAVAVIDRLRRDVPEARVSLVVGVRQTFANPKVSSLAALTARAAFDVLVISDSDMRVGPDYLRRVVAPLARPEVGLVTCAYRGVAPATLTAKLEALHMGVTFLPEVIVARRFLDMQFALGATLALRRSDLAQIGGWQAVGDYLAEDSQLASRIAQTGKKVVLSDYLVDAYLGHTTWQEQWHREVRWARTNRVVRPKEYTGIILTFTVPLAVLLLPLDPLGLWSWLVVGGALVVRWTTAWLIAEATHNRSLCRYFAWLPLRDFLSALTWCAGAGGRHVVWRGQRYRLLADGRMKPRAG